ncbi:MAG TPA: DUF2252 domain-containing protein [Solirubrobacteraceae bacterium]|nr:DUF2252 domain-containing protein [Solirubrobacteraceae bacterium]
MAVDSGVGTEVHGDGAVLDSRTAAERAAAGKAGRRGVPRSSQGAFTPPPDRPDPVGILERQALTRVPDLVPIRYGRMLESPFSFYRGAAAIMAHDLAATPATGLPVQCSGDAHLSNFGVFASPDRRLVFDVNDFDETLRGPWEWDIKRLAVSLLIAAQNNDFAAPKQDRAVTDAVRSYREAMAEFAAKDALTVWYARVEVDDLVARYGDQLTPRNVRKGERELTRVRTRDSALAFTKLTEIVDGEPRIIDRSPLIVPIEKMAQGVEREEMFDALHRILVAYRNTLPDERRRLVEQFRLADLARKVVGVGSVGTRCWIALLLGRDDDQPLFLQFKEADRSVLEEYAGASPYPNHGERVVVGQRSMQATSDIFLGWVRVADPEGANDFYGRQLNDWKGSAEIAQLGPGALAAYGRLCGWTLARAHARTGDRHAIAGYLGSGAAFDRAILEFARAYAEQNDRDYAALQAAAASGRITAELGV